MVFIVCGGSACRDVRLQEGEHHFGASCSHERFRQFQPKGDVKVVLIDGQELANYMIECGVGVSLKQSYLIKRLDTDYFEE